MSASIALGAFLISGTPGYRQAGVHHYARSLVHALAGLPTLAGAQLWISPTAASEVDAHARSVFRVRTASVSTESPLRRLWFEQTQLPALLHADSVSVYHGLGFVLPLRARLRRVVSVMDLSFLTHPETHRLFNRTYLRLFTRWSCLRADRVIAISESTRRDVLAHFGLPPERVVAIPLGVNPNIRPPNPAILAAFRQTHRIGERSIFYLGSLEPRKNLKRLVAAVAQLPSNTQLFIGGGLGWMYDDTLRLIQTLGVGERVTLVGHVPAAELPLWYAACAAFAYPSLYEGFGLPVLEAMACGAAVVTSNVSSLPEVTGDAALLVDPTETGQLADALTQILENGGLREALRGRAIRQAAGFTWQATAERTAAVYTAAT
jgi:glycosyltransferase involved in cell wall biosynthesis